MENARVPLLPDQLARRALVGFILTFIAARSVVFLIMSGRMPNLYFFLGDTHVHHLNYGIFLLAAVGGYLLFRTPTPRNSSIAAVVYGIAMALTFDEFGMWLHLGGSYWQRASVDAIVVVAALLALIAFARSIRTYESRHVKAFAALVVAVVIFTVVLYDASVRIGRLEGPRLRDLELASSP
jgi:glucose dehydrogenase